MKATKTKPRVADEQKIKNVLSEDFAPKSITIYRYNWASLHVRIIDRRFKGKSIIEREAMVDPLLSKLPENVEAQITILLLLTPQETKDSVMNMEFGKPSELLS